MRIVVIGGTGYAGSHIAREATRRGHDVVSVSRSAPEEEPEGVAVATADARERETLENVLDGADVVVAAIAPRGDMEGRVADAISLVADLARARGARLGVVGGAGSLRVADDGPRLFETPDFPPQAQPEAREMATVLDRLHETDDGLDWFYVSPSGMFGAWAPGEATGRYRVGGDVLLVDESGRSSISGPDFAAAFLDEIEEPRHRRRRFTVGY